MADKQSVVVTGVSTGIGWGITKVLIANGFTVFGSVRRQSDADRLQPASKRDDEIVARHLRAPAQTGGAIHQDLVNIRDVLRVHIPVFAMICDLEKANGFKEFLDTVRTLDQKVHQDFILACHHYARAVKEVGFDAEMLFIRLVSSIETLSTNMPLDHKDDKLEKQGVTDLIEQVKRTIVYGGDTKNAQ